ncbi:MAG TPA: hypothetical protein VGF34_13295 [Stellaceae bacterium]|jgi:hypothetical protein
MRISEDDDSAARLRGNNHEPSLIVTLSGWSWRLDSRRRWVEPEPADMTERFGAENSTEIGNAYSGRAVSQQAQPRR